MLGIYGEWFHCPPGYACGYKKRMKNKEQYLLDLQSSRQKARNNARQPGTAEHQRKAILSLVSTGCYFWLLSTSYQIARKQRLFVETLYAYVR